MVRKKLLLLLALLISAATGAWADKSETINTKTEGRTVYTGTHFKITASYNSDDDGLILYDNKNVIHGTATIESLTGEIITKIEMHMSWGGTVATKTTTTEGKLEATDRNSNVNDISVFNINATNVEIGTTAGKGEGWVQIDKFVIYYEPYTYAVALNDGGEDTQNWTILPAEATTTGVAEGETVTLKYSGTREVKSITATFEPDPMLAVPMTIEAITAGLIKIENPKAGMQYSLDGGATKNAVTTGNIALNAGDKVQFYGNGTSITKYGASSMFDCTMINGGGDGFTCKVYGNIMSLLDEENFATATTLSDIYTFRFLFFRNPMLTDASGLLLPAATLQECCYQQMFYDCIALTAAPALPATELAASCYSSMFDGCTALTAAPVLPATELVMYCYNSMFNNCKKLATVTCLATSGINQDNSTTYWLNGAGSQAEGTKTVNTVSTANWPVDNNGGIPTGWTRVNIDN